MRADKKIGDYKLVIYSSYIDEVKMICNLIFKLFHYKPSLRKRLYGFNKTINYEIIIHSKKLVYFFNKNFDVPIGKKSLTINLPKLSDNLIYKLNFIRGVIDGNGCVRKNSNLSICSGSYLFLIGMKKLLNEIIKSSEVLFNGTCYNLYISMNSLPKLFYLLYYSGDYFYERRKSKLEQILSTKQISVFNLNQ